MQNGEKIWLDRSIRSTYFPRNSIKKLYKQYYQYGFYKIRLLQKKIGQKKFYKKLLKIDPLIKNQFDSNDTQRTIRAFEIKKFTNKSITTWFKKTKILFDSKNFIKIYIDFPREELILRIKNRVDQMFELGAILEVKKFI